MTYSIKSDEAIVRIKKILNSKTCVNCGTCVALDENNDSRMVDTEWGPIPEFGPNSKGQRKIFFNLRNQFIYPYQCLIFYLNLI